MWFFPPCCPVQVLLCTLFASCIFIWTNKDDDDDDDEYFPNCNLPWLNTDPFFFLGLLERWLKERFIKLVERQFEVVERQLQVLVRRSGPFLLNLITGLSQWPFCCAMLCKRGLWRRVVSSLSLRHVHSVETIEFDYETVPKPSNATIFNDLQWPLTQISMSRSWWSIRWAANPHADPDHQQKSITSRGSSPPWPCLPSLVDVRFRVRQLPCLQNDRQNDHITSAKTS